MMNKRMRPAVTRSSSALAPILLAGLNALASPAWAQDDAAPRQALKVCQDPNNPPFSNAEGTGIENRIAQVFGKAMGLPVTFYSFPQRMNFIRNTLRFKLPGSDYPCDIVMGVPVGFDQVSVTKPYYRSTYALVFAQGKGLDQVKTAEDFLALDKAKLQRLKIGLFDQGPGTEWVKRHDLVDQTLPYHLMNADPSQYPGEMIEKDLASGKIDAAVVWGPIGGYFALRVKTPRLTVIPLKSEPGIKFDYQMAMGVRYGEPEWKKQVEGLIDSQRDAIQAILKEFGVPVVDESFSDPKNAARMAADK
jgi:mxaJ protein